MGASDYAREKGEFKSKTCKGCRMAVCKIWDAIMNKTGLVFDAKYLQHVTGKGHPECPERLVAVLNGLKTSGLLEKLVLIKAKPADQRWIDWCMIYAISCGSKRLVSWNA